MDTSFTLGLFGLKIILFCFVGTPLTSATFYIEIFHRNGCYLKEKLFECSHHGDTAAQISRPNHGVRNFWCLQITNLQRKHVYSQANFFSVTFPKLKEDRGIVLVLEKNVPFSYLVGVPILGQQLDWPPLLEDRRHLIAPIIRQECIKKIRQRFFGNIPADMVVEFMSTADFRRFVRPIPQTVDRFKAFAQVLENIIEFYLQNFRRHKNDWEELETPVKDVRSAVQLLVQKLIEPCFIASYRSEIDPEAPRIADALCRIQCRFIAVGFSAFFGSKSPRCAHLLSVGHCSSDSGVCECAARASALHFIRWTRHVPMFECSNDLRLGIRRWTSQVLIEKDWGKVESVRNLHREG